MKSILSMFASEEKEKVEEMKKSCKPANTCSLPIGIIIVILRNVEFVCNLDTEIRPVDIIRQMFGRKHERIFLMYSTHRYYVNDLNLSIRKYFFWKDVTVVDFFRSNLNDSHLKEICSTIESFNLSQLKDVRFSNTMMRKDMLDCIVKSMQLGRTRIRKLDLSRNPLGGGIGRLLLIMRQVETPIRLKVLRLDEIELKDADLSSLARMMKVNKTIERLCLNKICRINTARMRLLMQGTWPKENTTLKVLELRLVYMQFRACHYLLNAISFNHGIHTLLLGHNRVDFEDGEILFETFASNKSVVHLDLAGNNLSEAGEAILDIFKLKANTTLKVINFQNTKILYKFREEIEKYLDVSEVKRKMIVDYPNNRVNTHSIVCKRGR